MQALIKLLHNRLKYVIILYMNQVPRAENHPLPEQFQLSRVQKCGQFAARLGLAATCIIPAADFALSDVAMAKVYQVTQDSVTMSSPAVEHGVETGIVGLAIMAESIGLGLALSKTKKMRGVFGDFDEYLESKQERMSSGRKVASKIVNAPYAGLKKAADGFEVLGEKIATRKSKTARVLGKFTIDTAKVNALGTSTIIMQETMADNPPSFARNTYLAGLITGSWLGAAEGIRQIYRNVEFLRPPMAAIGKTFETMTTMDVVRPWDTPVGSMTLSMTAIGLAYTGWKISEFHQQREELTRIKLEDLLVADNPTV